MRNYISAALVSIMLLAGTSWAIAAESVVESVTVSVKAGDAPPPSRVIKRMEQSVLTVADHVLTGRKVADVTAGKVGYEKVIKEVFDRVLVGYSVQDVTIEPGPATLVAVRIQPWGDVVRSVRVETDLGGVSPQVGKLIVQDMAGIEDKVSQVLIGLPVDAVDWAGGVSKSVIREILAAQLPEFRANLEIVPGQVTTVKVLLTPVGPLVQDARVTLRSRTFPNFLLLEARPVVEDAAQPLRGLPVAFVERHGSYFRDRLTKVAAGHAIADRYGLTMSSVLKPGVDTELVISAETAKYNIAVEGFIDVGRRQDNTSGRLHVGRYVGKYDELFMEVTLIPSTVTWQFVPGWGHRLGSRTEIGTKYNISNEEGLFWLRQDLDGNWSLRLERTPVRGMNELAIRYKLHEFLSVEYIFSSNENWLRLVGNL